MEAWLEAALAEGRKIPVPAAKAANERTSSSHSGRFLVRMSGTLHAQLARAAESEHLSLNRFVTKVLASSVSPARPAQPQTGMQRREATEPAQSSKRSRGLRIALATNLALVVFAGVAAIVLLVLALQNGF
jgi:hypothetical protein